MSNYAETRFGLPDDSPFDILKRPRAEVSETCTAPLKRGPKPKTKAQILVVNAESNIGYSNQAGAAKTAKIKGRL